MHPDFNATGTVQLSWISKLVFIVILVGMSACGSSETNTNALLSKESATTTKSGPADWTRDATSPTLPKPWTSESGSYAQELDSNLNLKPNPKVVLTQAPLANQPPIGTEVGKTLPQFEIALFGARSKSTDSLANLGQPVFLFFFTTW